MKITFDKEAFIDAIKWTYGILGTKDDGATVRMQVVDKGKVRFSSVSQGNERTIVVEALIEDPFMITNSDTGEEEYGSIELVASALKKVPSQITSDKVVLTYNTNKSKTQVLADVGLKLRLPIMSSQDWPVTSTEKMNKVGDVSTADLFNTIDLMSSIPTSTMDKTLGALACIDFRPYEDDPDNKMILMAIDGYVMSTRLLAYDKADGFETVDGSKWFIIPLSDIKAMSDVDKTGSVSIYTDDASILFAFDDNRTSKVNKLTKNHIEDYSKLVFDDKDESFDVKYDDLFDAINRFGGWSKEELVYMDLVDDDGWKLKIHNVTNTWNSVVQVTNVDVTDEYHVVFSYDMIYKPLKSMNRPVIRYRFSRIEDGKEDYNYGIVWDQLKTDGKVDDTVYIMSLPEKKVLETK